MTTGKFSSSKMRCPDVPSPNNEQSIRLTALRRAMILRCAALPTWVAAQALRLLDALTLEPVAGLVATMPGSDVRTVSSAAGTLDLYPLPHDGTLRREHLTCTTVVLPKADLLRLEGPYCPLPRNHDL